VKKLKPRRFQDRVADDKLGLTSREEHPQPVSIYHLDKQKRIMQENLTASMLNVLSCHCGGLSNSVYHYSLAGLVLDPDNHDCYSPLV